MDALTPYVVDYAKQRKNIIGAVPLLMLSQVRDVGATTEALYSAEIFKHYDPEKGFWFKGDHNGAHSWAMRWHAFQAQLPPEHQITLK